MDIRQKLKELIAAGATAEQLAQTRGGWGPHSTWLHAAVSEGLLPQIPGGATAKQLASARDQWGGSALSVAAPSRLQEVTHGATAADLANDLDGDGESSLFLALKYGQACHIKGRVQKGMLSKEELNSALRYQCGRSYALPDVKTVLLLMKLGASPATLRGYISRCRRRIRLAGGNFPLKLKLLERLGVLTTLARNSKMRICHPPDITSELI